MGFRSFFRLIGCMVSVLYMSTAGFATDYSLSPNGSSGGTLADPNNNDWFQIITTTDGKLIATTNSVSGLEIDLFIYTADKSTQLSGYDISTGTIERTHHNSLGPGTYYIRAYRYSGSGSYTITSEFTPTSYDTDPENNDEALHATTLASNGSDTGHLGHLYYYTVWDTYDWWAVTIPQDGKLQVTTVSDSTLDIDLFIYDVDLQTQIAGYDISTGTIERTHHNALEPGTYYIKAYKYAGYGSYSITSVFTQTTLDNDTENNDTTAMAVALSPNGSDTGHLGHHSLVKTDVNDYWKITVPNDGVLTVTTVSDSTMDIDLFLYDEDGQTQIAGYDISTGINERTHFNGIGPGTYFVRAYQYHFNGYGSYSITSTFTQTSLTSEMEPNNDTSSAVSLVTQTTITGHIGHYEDMLFDNNDYYQITVPAGWDTLYVRSLSDSTIDIDITIYASDGTTTVTSGSIYGTSEWATAINPSASTYYVRLYRYTGWGAYAFIVSNSTAARPSGDVWAGVEDLAYKTPEAFVLLSPYPNPFNPSTTVQFTIPDECRVRLAVYDILGREITVLANEVMEPGNHAVVWNARDPSGNRVGAGVYIFNLRAGTFTSSQKAVLVK